MHEKLYCFSHPAPIAFVGSFNPSGNMPDENPEIIRELGDQDRGHNVLAGLVDPVLVAQLTTHPRCLHRMPPGLLYCFSVRANETIRGKDTAIYFWPRIYQHPVGQFLAGVRGGARVRVVASHIRTERVPEVMQQAHHVCGRTRGNGAVREACDLILKARTSMLAAVSASRLAATDAMKP